LLQAAQVPARLLGFVSDYPADRSAAHYLGSMAGLGQLCRQHRPQELIFSGKDLSASQIMDCMVALKNQGLDFKILPQDCDYIIGSHSRNSRGQYYARTP
jgi:hypothetical protein